jgi:hypothetical protein
MEIMENVKQKKSNPLLDSIVFKTYEEGKCVQMLHLGSYDDEPESFVRMEEFCRANNLERISKQHKEIYLNNPQNTPTDKLKTVLRFKVR